MMTEPEVINCFLSYRDRFQTIAVSIMNPIDLYDEAEKSVVREALCSGSDMFIGYYCPSLIFDIVVGNVHRGRILQRVTKRSKPTHRYGFDEQNRLRTVAEIPDEECRSIDNRAIIQYRDRSINIIHINRFDGKAYIDVLAESLYDSENRLMRYTVGLMEQNRCFEITQELYSYSDHGLDTVELWKCSQINDRTYIPQIDTFRFHHDPNGYIDSYETVGDDFWDGTIFDIPEKKRRKV